MFLLLLFLLVIGTELAGPPEGPQWGNGKSTSLMPGPSDLYKVAPHCAGTAWSLIAPQCPATARSPIAPQCAAIEKSLGSATLSGGPVRDTLYQLQQLHFHFGCSSFQGSEHTVSGSSYPVEVHFVFYNTIYTDFARVADKADGLTVVGAFLSSKPNGVLGRLRIKFEMIVAEGKSVPVIEADEIFLKDLVPALNNGSPYYTYQGSLTTPPCFQSVLWIVLTETAPFNSTQLIAFNRLLSPTGYSDRKMCNNFRPVQPRCCRDFNSTSFVFFTIIHSKSSASFTKPEFLTTKKPCALIRVTKFLT
ncbi:carbonic anhydrase-like [Stylophora pistillata]|uniref:carbonic anhydrase-like n=1 Tax=Stylophora pistillata TaxID=50429 RepID=UPI000C0573C0|nr:carbonic anhydrase-like [Stylophora pistillata]